MQVGILSGLATFFVAILATFLVPRKKIGHSLVKALMGTQFTGKPMLTAPCALWLTLAAASVRSVPRLSSLDCDDLCSCGMQNQRESMRTIFNM